MQLRSQDRASRSELFGDLVQPVSRRIHLLFERRKGYERLEPSDLGSRSADPASTWDGAEGSEADGEQDRSSRVPRLHPARFLNEGVRCHCPRAGRTRVRIADQHRRGRRPGGGRGRHCRLPRSQRVPVRPSSTGVPVAEPGTFHLSAFAVVLFVLYLTAGGASRENHRQAGDGRGRCGPTVPGSGLDGPSCRDPVLVLPLRAAVVSRSIASTERCTTCWSGHPLTRRKPCRASIVSVMAPPRCRTA